MARDMITLECPECKRRNYASFRNKRTGSERLTLQKYCRWCRRHTAHKEIK